MTWRLLGLHYGVHRYCSEPYVGTVALFSLSLAWLARSVRPGSFRMAELTPGMVRWLQRLFGLRGDIRGVTALQGPSS